MLLYYSVGLCTHVAATKAVIEVFCADKIGERDNCIADRDDDKDGSSGGHHCCCRHAIAAESPATAAAAAAAAAGSLPHTAAVAAARQAFVSESWTQSDSSWDVALE